MDKTHIRVSSSPLLHGWVRGKIIGTGSHGAVHLAINKANGELFVAKSSRFGNSLRTLENEANILESLNSPYVIKYKGRELAKDGLCVFMEYMGGGSLSEVIEKFGGGLDEDVIRLYVRQILYGLKHLRENGILHCDLKCQNVLLSTSGNVKLADFGCAKRLKDANSNANLSSCSSFHSIAGTPLWMAPEVLRNEELDFASDVWSLGCTVIEMATGRPPWGAKVSNPLTAVLKIACSDDIPQFPKHFSEEGFDFLTKCLDRDPKRRWTAEELLKHPFIRGSDSGKKECRFSPASVLDIGNYEWCYDSDESESPNMQNNDEFLHRKLFSSTAHYCNTRTSTAAINRKMADNDPRSSGDWITVRSGWRC